MAITSKNLDSPDDSRTFPNGKAEVVRIGDHSVSRAAFQPGWKWSESVKPIAGTDSCQFLHVGYVVSGALHVETEDGDSRTLAAGDAYRIEPGHDAWVEGDEPWVSLEFDAQTAEGYAKPQS